MFNRTTLLILLAALAAGLGLWAAQRVFKPMPAAPVALPGPAVDQERLSSVRLFSRVRVLPGYALEQSDGTPLTPDELQGHWTVVFLGFTHCPDVCPTTLSELAQAQKQWTTIDESRRPRVLFISVDPERDTPATTGEYAAYFHPDTIAATAPEPALNEFATSLGLVYMKVANDANDAYTMDHSSALVVLDPMGRQAGLIRPPFVPADIAADLALLAREAP